MKLKKFAVIMMTVLLCATIIGCKRDKDPKEYSITFNVDGGTMPANVPAKYTVADGLATLPTPTKDGFDFVGWLKDGRKWSSIPKGTTGDLVFTASWREKQASSKRINYTLNGGTLPDNAPTSFVPGVGLATLPTPTKTGELFAGWYDADDNLVISIAASVNKDVTLIAKWGDAAEQYNITYVLNDGTLEANAPATYFSSYGLKNLPHATKEGYSLAYWGDENGDKVTEIAVGTTGDVTLQAIWEKVMIYNITYIIDPEEGTMPAEYETTYRSDIGYELPIPTPKNSEDSFQGWYNGGTSCVSIAPGTHGDLTFTAQFGALEEYESRWELNANTGNWNGQGMNFGIKVLPTTEYDPFLAGYTGTSKQLKQEHQRKVEAAYNIIINWSNYEDSAPWGPERVKFINSKYMSKELQNADMYVLSIASQWIPTLVKGDSIAELYNVNTEEGIFKNLSNEEGTPDGYVQNKGHNDATSVQGRVYGYAPGTVRPDYFMYYNVNLVKQCNLEDPAELWLKGEWTMTRFDQWVKEAQNTLDAGSYALDMGFAESIIGLTASNGQQMTTVNPPRINFTRSAVTDGIVKLQSYMEAGYYYGRGVQDVSPNFSAGKSLLHHGELWFMKNNDRFNPGTMAFTIGVVPYPTADGQGGIVVTTQNEKEAIVLSTEQDGTKNYLVDNAGNYIKTVDMSESTFSIPFTGTSCFSMLNVQNGKNGINSEIATQIFHDLTEGLGEDPYKKVTLTDEEIYRNFLDTKFDRDIDIEVIMSCQGTTYFELMELLSMTVGGGSHFGPDAFWPLAASIVKGKDSPTTKLNEVLDKYKSAMKSLGYNVA